MDATTETLRNMEYLRIDEKEATNLPQMVEYLRKELNDLKERVKVLEGEAEAMRSDTLEEELKDDQGITPEAHDKDQVLPPQTTSKEQVTKQDIRLDTENIYPSPPLNNQVGIAYYPQMVFTQPQQSIHPLQCLHTLPKLMPSYMTNVDNPDHYITNLPRLPQAPPQTPPQTPPSVYHWMHPQMHPQMHQPTHLQAYSPTQHLPMYQQT